MNQNNDSSSIMSAALSSEDIEGVVWQFVCVDLEKRPKELVLLSLLINK